MPLSINNSGDWEDIEEVYVNDSGTWRFIDEIYVNNSGTWVLVFESLGELVTFSGDTRTATGSAATFGLANTGERTTTDSETGTKYWINPQVGMNKYSVRCTSTQTLDGGTTGSWLNLGTTRTWSLNPPGSGPVPRTSTLTLEFALTSDTSTVLETCNVTLVAHA